MIVACESTWKLTRSCSRNRSRRSNGDEIEHGWRSTTNKAPSAASPSHTWSTLSPNSSGASTRTLRGTLASCTLHHSSLTV